MKSYNVSEDIIKICLTDDEVKSLFGSFDMIDYDSPHCRAVLDSLICSALPGKMLPFNCEKVLIEVSPEKDGCSIQLTRLYDNQNNEKIKKQRHQYILLFNGSEDMIDYIKSLNIRDVSNVVTSDLYRINDKYALFITENRADDNKYCEFGKCLNRKSVAAAMIAERGKHVCADAIKKLFVAFNKKTP